MNYHTSVLLEEAVENLVTDRDGTYFDGTLGGGGHTGLILKKLSDRGAVVAMDRDGEAISRCKEIFADEGRVKIIKGNFSKMNDVIEEKVKGVLLDLGVSSRQLDAPERGFSFSPDRPLDLRMDAESEKSALELIRESSEEHLARLFYRNADITFSRRLAKALKEHQNDFNDTNLIHHAMKQIFPKGLPQPQKMLARIFQALRMELNSELQEIETALHTAVKKVQPGGRICVITFHSVEDRLVKKIFQSYERDCLCPPRSPVCVCGGQNRQLKKVFKKPIEASSQEVQRNPRSRSAKLRVVERVMA